MIDMKKKNQNRFKRILLAFLCIFCMFSGVLFAMTQNGFKAQKKGVTASAETVLYPENLVNFNQYLYRMGDEYIYRTPVYDLFWQTSATSYLRLGISFCFVLDSSFNPVNKIYVQFSGGNSLSIFNALYGFSSSLSGLASSDAVDYLVSGNSMGAYNVHFGASGSFARFWDMVTVFDCDLTVENFGLYTSVKLVNPSDSSDIIASVSFSSAVYQGRSQLYYTSFSSINTEIYKELTVQNAALLNFNSSIQIFGTDKKFVFGAIYTESQYQNFGNEQYQAGQTNGYDKGYQDGLSAGNGATFFSLIAAVVDAPIKAFTSLFNFEILGMNITSFVLSLLTAALVIAAIRLFSHL